MAQKYRTAKGFLPKPKCLKRVNASCPSSSDWINISINPNSTDPKCGRKRVATRYIAPNDSICEDQPNVSPASSPEVDYLLGTGHEFLGIEVDEQSTPTAHHPLCISDPNSCCSSQQSANVPSICALSQQLPLEKPSTFSNCDSKNFEYLNLLQRDDLASVYIDLSKKPARCKDAKSGLVSRISLLARRLYSDRSMWLHRHTLSNGYDSTVHKSRTFLVSKCNAGRISGIPGLRSFQVTEFRTYSTAECAVGHHNDDLKPVSTILLPVSGCRSKIGASLLGDTIGPNDAIRVYSPWNTCVDPSEPDSIILHSFFWAERLKRHGTAQHLETTPPSESIDTGRIPLICQCCISASAQDFRSCSSRFRSVNDASENIREDSFDLDSLKNPIIILCINQLWLTQKIWHSLIVFHHTLGLGLIMMPSSWGPIATQMHLQRIDDIKLGGLYSVENLFQLSSNQIPKCFQEDIHAYFADIRAIPHDPSAHRLSQFIQKWDTTLSTYPSNSSCSCCVWDARIATFKLLHANYIRIPHPTQFSITLPWFSRCSLDGLLLNEVPEGSLLFSDVIKRLRSSAVSIASSSSDDIRRFERSVSLAVRLFYLLLSDRVSTTKTVVPCICLSGIPSPLNVLQHTSLKGKFSSHILPVPHGFRLVVTNAYAGPGCVFVDSLSSIRMWNKKPPSQTHIGNPLVPDIAYTQLDSVHVIDSIRLHELVRFSGVLVAVDTNRSHTWPICAICLSDKLRPHHAERVDDDDAANPISCDISAEHLTFDCGMCGNQIVDPLHSFELEVLVVLDTLEGETSVQSHILLIMSSVRLFKLLGLPPTTNPKDLQLNPRLMLSKCVEHITGLVVRIDDKCPLHIPSVSNKRVIVVLDLGFNTSE